MKEKAAPGPCKKCGEPIQPGQLWMPRLGAHVACRKS